jgi:Uma2 family endonuclease
MDGSAALKMPEKMSIAEYLESEMHSEVRHEYRNGYVRGMAGASKNHERVGGRLFGELYGHLKGSPCEVFKSDMKVLVDVDEQQAFFYPDLVVGCDPADDEAFYLRHPKLIIEVLSVDEFRDRVEKRLIYQRLPSLEEYAVVSQDPAKPEITIFRRADGWEPGAVHRSGGFELRSIGFQGRVEDLYPAS